MIDNIITSLPYSGAMSSNIGGRRENQDSCDVAAAGNCIIVTVCDGMGGGPGGKTASSLAVGSIIGYVKENLNDDSDKPKVLRDAIVYANEVLRNKIMEEPELDGMGTTVTAVILSPDDATIAHVGDSRVYQMRGSHMVFRTADHSKVGELVRKGDLTEEQARLSSFSNIITRALGVGDTVEVDIKIRPYEKGDRFILCTDGVWGAMPQKELLKEFSKLKSLEGTLDQINIEVEKAGRQKGGGHDNYTAIIIETKKSSILKEVMSKKDRILFYVLAAICAISILVNVVLFLIPSPKDIKEENAALRKENIELKQQVASLTDSLTNRAKPDSVNVSVALEKEEQSVGNEYEENKKTKKEVISETGVPAGQTQKQNNVTQDTVSVNMNDLIKKLTSLQKSIRELQGMEITPPKNRKLKEEKRDSIINCFKTMEFPPYCKADVKWVIEKLGNKITVRAPSLCESHCNDIIHRVDKIIDEIKKVDK